MSQRVNPTTLTFNDGLGKFQPFLTPLPFPTATPTKPHRALLGLYKFYLVSAPNLGKWVKRLGFRGSSVGGHGWLGSLCFSPPGQLSKPPAETGV